MNFEPVLNVREQVQLNYTGNLFYKCSVDSELGLLGITCGTKVVNRQFVSVDMRTKEVISVLDAFGPQAHHWVTRNGEKYLSLQIKANEIKMFVVDKENKSFLEETSLTLTLGAEEHIAYPEFDSDFKHIFILPNKQVLEKRTLNNISEVAMSIVLDQKVVNMQTRQMVLSHDGSVCAIGGGQAKPGYMIDLTQKHNILCSHR